MQRGHDLHDDNDKTSLDAAPAALPVSHRHCCCPPPTIAAWGARLRARVVEVVAVVVVVNTAIIEEDDVDVIDVSVSGH